MRQLLIIISSFFFSVPLLAQDNLTLLLISGKEDTKTFLQDYLRPGTQGLIYNLSSGWYQTAEVKDPLRFEISVIANASVNLDQHQSFLLNTSDYQNIQFADGETRKTVATILGNNDPAARVILKNESVTGDEQIFFELPQGLGSEGIDFIPTAFLQARLGVFRATEVKFRYFPRRDLGGADVQILGGAIQHEVTQWLAPKYFPLSVSGMVAYSTMDGNYEFTEDQIVQGDNQRLDSHMKYWMFSGIFSTKFPIVNFYGGLSYLQGTSQTHLLGTYSIVNENSGETIVSLTDPLSLTSEVGGMTGNIGISLSLGLFKINGEYNFTEYQTLSAGVHIEF